MKKITIEDVYMILLEDGYEPFLLGSLSDQELLSLYYEIHGEYIGEVI